MAKVNYSIHGERVFVRYKDLVEEAKTAGLTAEELIAAANEAIAQESGSGEVTELPEMKELMSLKTRVAKEVWVEESDESESAAAAAKWVVVASLRYMTEKAEESGESK